MSTITNTSDSNTSDRYTTAIFDTPFKSLPNPKRVWLGSPGSHEEGLGRLTILTPDVVAAAATSEIRTGQRIGLGWDMMKLEYSQFGRQRCQHEIIPLWGPDGIGYGACFDDSYSMNPRKCDSIQMTTKLSSGHVMTKDHC